MGQKVTKSTKKTNNSEKFCSKISCLNFSKTRSHILEIVSTYHLTSKSKKYF